MRSQWPGVLAFHHSHGPGCGIYLRQVAGPGAGLERKNGWTLAEWAAKMSPTACLAASLCGCEMHAGDNSVCVAAKCCFAGIDAAELPEALATPHQVIVPRRPLVRMTQLVVAGCCHFDTVVLAPVARQTAQRYSAL
jgi:hypothetical protein